MSVKIHLNLDCTSPWAGIPDGWMERQSWVPALMGLCFLCGWMWPAASGPCRLDLPPTVTIYTIELWARTNPFPLHCFGEAVLLQQQEEKLRQTIAGFTNGDHGSLGLMVYLIENNVTFLWEIPYLPCLLKAFSQALNLKAVRNCREYVWGIA